MLHSKNKAFKRGSALLVVLGFLTFLSISAIAFAIYMRVERQATSNYKHSITARHLLETALFRAMDEIDSDLRLVVENRFPDWQGRVRASPAVYQQGSGAAVERANYHANEQEARLLSFEALSFLPASVVNGVRTYAVSTDTNQTAVMQGAKWRTLSMPIQNKVSTDSTMTSGSSTVSEGVAFNSAGQSVVGRYAYLAVNLSDMLDVNNSSVSARNVVDQIGIAHLFKSGMLETFENQRSNDVTYATLQDFYNCMGKSSDTFPGQFFERGLQGDTSDSPYLRFLRRGLSDAFSCADYHVLVTGAQAKSEPRRESAFNLKESPFSSTTPPVFKAEFVRALNELWSGGTDYKGENNSRLADNRMFLPGQQIQFGDNAFAAMVYDYFSADIAPARLDVPSCKLAPMICGIFAVSEMAPTMYHGTADGTPPTTPVYAQLVGGNMGAGADAVGRAQTAMSAFGLQVRLCWPFRNVDTSRFQNDTFTIKVDGWLHAEPNPSIDFTARGFEPSVYGSALRFTGTTTPFQPLYPNPNNINQCFFTIPVGISFDCNPSQLTQTMGRLDSSGTFTQEPGSQWQDTGFSTAIIVFVKVLKNGVVVDSVPQFYPKLLGQNSLYSGSSETDDFTLTPKLYFQSNKSGPVAAASGAAIGWEWNALEVPDPRFNHRPANWVQPEAGVVSVSGFSLNTISQRIKDLFGQEGRDNDIFMSVAGTGNLQSPGELGFIVRPYDFARNKGMNVDFRLRDLKNPSFSWDNSNDDSDAYFRTIRLYDHGSTDEVKAKHDRVYEYFYAADDNGNFLGSRARVNPLSKLDTTLISAIDRVPYDYWVATTNAAKPYPNAKIDTESFWDPWVTAVTNLVHDAKVGQKDNPYRSIRTVYPELRLPGSAITDKKGWYAAPTTSGNLSTAILGGTATVDLSEVDRKMLYAFSLDSFSDRQQLFLYIVQAESIAPTASGEARSLAGGRAVALVWRDPYPMGVTVANGGNMDYNGDTSGNWYYYSGAFANEVWHQDRLGHSPWWKTANTNATTARTSGYHEHQILFFKQLDN